MDEKDHFSGIIPMPEKPNEQEGLDYRTILRKGEKAIYHDMVSELRDNPESMDKYKEFLSYFLSEKNKDFDITPYGIKLNGILICDFAVIVLQVRKIYGLDGIQYEVELLVLSSYEPPKSFWIKLPELQLRRWVDEKLGIKYICPRDNHMTIKWIIQTISRIAPNEEVFAYSGWSKEKPNVYIMDGNMIEKDSSLDEYTSDVVCKHALDMLNIAERRLTIPILSIVLLSLVQSAMISKGEFFKGVICLVGQSQSLKTTMLALFFDLISGRKPDVNFESTIAAIVRTIANKRDNPVIVDDLKPPPTRAARSALIMTLEKIIRMCSDDSGGVQKAGAKNTTIANSAQVIVSITAEEIPVNVYSSLARLLVLEMNRKSVDKKVLTKFQENHHIYRAFIKDYIRFICIQGVDNYCASLSGQFLKERDIMRNKLFSKDIQVDNRTNDMCVWLHISFKQFLKYVAQVGVLTPEQVEVYHREASTIFLDLMTAQAERINELDDISRFFKGLRYLLDTKEADIGQLQARNTGYIATDEKTTIGFRKDGYVFLKNNLAFQKVVDYYRQYGKEFAVSESTLRRMLNDNGHLLSKTEKSLVHRLHVKPKTYQCIKFEEAKFNKLLEGGKDDGAENTNEIPDNRGIRENANIFLGRGD